MSRAIKAIYENGVFRPTEPVDLPPKTPVEVREAGQASGQTLADFPAYSGPLPRPIPFAAVGEGPEDLAERAGEYLAQYGFGRK